MILLKLDGYKSSEIVKIVNASEMSVYNWVNRFESFGIVGLKTKSSQGRKPILKEQHLSKVKAAVKQERKRLSPKKIIEEKIGKPMWFETLTLYLKVITGVTHEKKQLKGKCDKIYYDS